jgi:hypothetical protein
MPRFQAKQNPSPSPRPHPFFGLYLPIWFPIVHHYLYQIFCVKGKWLNR